MAALLILPIPQARILGVVFDGSYFSPLLIHCPVIRTPPSKYLQALSTSLSFCHDFCGSHNHHLSCTLFPWSPNWSPCVYLWILCSQFSEIMFLKDLSFICTNLPIASSLAQSRCKKIIKSYRSFICANLPIASSLAQSRCKKIIKSYR